MRIFFFIILCFLSVILIWPGIAFAIAWYNNNVSLANLESSNESLSDPFDELPSPKNYDVDNIIKTKNCNFGEYLGPNRMGNVNCSAICSSSLAEEYEYKYIEAGQRIIVNNKILSNGSWCLPKKISQCNLNISYALAGTNGYECRTAYPELLGGVTGNEIIGCSPFNAFVDEKLKRRYTTYVPSHFRFDTDLNELLDPTDNTSFRFKCFIPRDQKQFYQPLSELGLGSRFQLTPNACGSFEPSGYYSLETGSCVCPNVSQQSGLLLHGEQETEQKTIQFRPCSSCTSGYGVIDEYSPQFGSKYGISIGIDCVDPANATFVDSTISKSPCGLNTLIRLRNEENKTRGCQRALLNATGSYSPEMLQRLLG